jgi:short-subunit dehydrogenase
MDIQGKIVVVTGASRGIGASTAKRFASLGAKVVLMARSENDLLAVASEIRQASGIAFVYPVDLRDSNATRLVCEEVLVEVGIPEVIIHNAGAGRWLFVDETPEGEEESMIALPYLASFRVTRMFLPKMLVARKGTILFVNSPVSLLPWSGAAGYAASRWALRGFSEALRADLAGTPIKVSEVILGETDSTYFEANPGSRERLPKISKLLPVLSPDDAARHVVKACLRGKKRHTAPFLLKITRKLVEVFPSFMAKVVQSGDTPHPSTLKPRNQSS